VKAFGGVDILASNASHAEWKKMRALQVDGAFLTTRPCIPHMYKSGRGDSIIYMGSVHSKEAARAWSSVTAASIRELSQGPRAGVFTKTRRIGTSSVTVEVLVRAQRFASERPSHVTEVLVTLFAVDDQGRKDAIAKSDDAADDPQGRRPAGLRKSARGTGLLLVLERHVDTGPIGGHLAVLDRRVELVDLGHPQVPEALAGGLDGILDRIIPGGLARSDEIGHPIDAGVLVHGRPSSLMERSRSTPVTVAGSAESVYETMVPHSRVGLASFIRPNERASTTRRIDRGTCPLNKIGRPPQARMFRGFHHPAL
jgi:hypothetical protein